MLDLQHDQLDNMSLRVNSPSGKPLVVVDDCALTGARFHRFLQRIPHRKVIFAPLYSHPDFRQAVQHEEDQVSACVSAHDLRDHAPENLGGRYEAWKAHRLDHRSGKRYWIGQPDHVCFPWSEPDTGVWNPDTEQVERGPRVVPPEHCLKARHGGPQDAPASSIQVQSKPTGPVRPASPVFFATLEENVIVANADKEVCVELSDTAADMWHALVENGTVGGAVDALMSLYDVDRNTLTSDLVEFARTLAARDLLSVPDEIRA